MEGVRVGVSVIFFRGIAFPDLVSPPMNKLLCLNVGYTYYDSEGLASPKELHQNRGTEIFARNTPGEYLDFKGALQGTRGNPVVWTDDCHVEVRFSMRS